MTDQAPDPASLNQEWWRVTLSSIGDAVIATDASGRIAFINPIAESLTGWTQSQAVGKPLEEVFVIVNESTGGRAENPVAKVLQSGHVVGLANHTILIHKDGRDIPIDDSAAPIRDERGQLAGVVLVFRDITERRRVELAQSYLAAIVESSNDAIIGKDLNGIITSWNKAAERIFGYTVEEAVGKPVTVIIPPDRYNEESAILERIRRGVRTEHFETIRVRKDGAPLNVSLTISPIRHVDGTIIGASKIARDITARKRAESELRFLSSLTRELSLMNDPDEIIRLACRKTGEHLGADRCLFAEFDPRIVNEGVVRHDWAAEGYQSIAGVYQLSEFLSPELARQFTTQGLTVEDVARHPALGSALENFAAVSVRSFASACFLRQALVVIICTQNRPRMWTEDDRALLATVAAHVWPLVQRARGEQALRDSETRFRLAVESSPNAMVMVNAGGTIVLVNSQAERMFGYSRDELVGQDVEILVPSRFRNGHPANRRQFSKNPLVRAMGAGRDLYGLRKDGRELAIEIGLNPIQVDDEMMTLSSIVDITERKAVEEARERLLEREQIARTKAEETNRLKDEFVATVSHELRTPLNSILGWATLLRTGSVQGEPARQAVETIERNARTQAQLIEDLLDVSRIITGKLRLEVRPVMAGNVVESALAAVRPMAEAKGIRLTSALNAESSPVSGDPARLQQIVWNLLTNAIKFTDRGGQVHVEVERAGEFIEVRVSDTGQGISAEFIPHVFDRFRQADSGTTRKHSGLGLGLSIVRHLVELHGGSVTAHSEGEGRGSTFIVRFPLTGAALPELDAPLPVSPHKDAVLPLSSVPHLEGVKALIVDDEADARKLLRAIVEECGAEVREAGSAAEGLHQAKQWGPSIILSDIGMPGEDGYEFIRQFREWEKKSGTWTPAVALTAYARVEDRLKALATGYQFHMAKPVDPAELVLIIANQLGRNL